MWRDAMLRVYHMLRKILKRLTMTLMHDHAHPGNCRQIGRNTNCAIAMGLAVASTGQCAVDQHSVGEIRYAAAGDGPLHSQVWD